MALSDYSQQYRRLLEETGSLLGFGETLEDMSATNMRLILRCVDHGIIDFLNPVNPRTGSLYQWTFSTKEIQITLPQGDYLVQLPVGINDIEGNLRPRNLVNNNVRFNPIERIDWSACRWRLEHPAAYAFAPGAYAVADNNTLIENAPSVDLSTASYELGRGNFSVLFDHVADQQYEYTATVKLNPERLRYAEQDWYGGAAMFPYVLACCLAQAEKKVMGEAGVNAASVSEELVKAIAIDSSRRPEFVGNMTDPSFGYGQMSIQDTKAAVRYFGNP